MSPALFVVNSETNEITSIGYGLLTLDQIETNIETQFKELLVQKNDVPNFLSN